jgi:AmmeMemoRadiSam system protein A
LREPAAGVFVSLHQRGATAEPLRGCVGLLEPFRPLWIAVCEAAASAALQDPRFPPVRPEELPLLALEISVLSASWPIHLASIQIGCHGLIVTEGSSRGLLLPQVAVERHWSGEQFLEQTCRKAGLRPDAWRHGAQIEAFTAEVFGECSVWSEL